MVKKKDSAKNVMYPHSVAKLEYYQSYLKRYLPVLRLAEFTDCINIFDVFCGTGIYKDGTKGSPILAYEAIKESYYTHQTKKLTPVGLYVNDLVKEKIDGVENFLQSVSADKYCNLGFYNKNAETFLSQITTFVNKESTKVRNLVLIDPYGYKGICRKQISNLLKKKNTEVILFLPVSQIYRFTGKIVSDEDYEIKALKDFIDSFFPSQNHPVRNNKVANELEFIDHIKEALSFDSKFYSASYYLQRDDKKHYYAMFFISPSIYGLQKTLEVKWSLNEETGEGFEQPKAVGLFDDQFKAEKKAEIYNGLKNKLIEYISNNNEINNNQLYEFTLKNMFLPKHTNEVLRELQNNNKIEVLDVNSNKKARKNSFYQDYSKYYKNKNVKVLIKII
ncbi:MAG: three-Cys-motif partner protein TcmP [Bacteroidales bacterium]